MKAILLDIWLAVAFGLLVINILIMWILPQFIWDWFHLVEILVINSVNLVLASRYSWKFYVEEFGNME